MRERLPTPARTAGDIAASLLLAVAIGVPMGGRFLDPGADVSVLPENRNPAPTPRFPRQLKRLGLFPPRFEAWVNDHFAFRSQLVRWHNAAKIFGFHIAPTERAVMGPDYWVYTSANMTFEAYRGTFRLSAKELDNWRRVLEARRDWLAARGIRYVFGLAPAKPTIYPEHLPPGVRRGEQTTLEQLRAHLAAHSDFELLDLHAPLLAAKEGDAEGDWLYFKLGTHWTERGGLIGAREILRALQDSIPGIELPEESDYRRVPLDSQGDSWAGRLHIPDLLLQGIVGLEPIAGWRSRAVDDGGGGLGTLEIPDRDGPTALLIHDSFGDGLWPFLGEQFATLHSRAGFQIDAELVNALQPDVVIQIMAERRLAAYRPSDSLSGGGMAARSAFESAPHRVAAYADAGAMREFEPWSEARLTPGEGPGDPPLEIWCRRAGLGFLLPEIDLPAGTFPVLRIELTSNIITQLSVLYMTSGRQEYISSRAVSAAVTKGHNVLFLRVPAEDLTGHLLILPGRRRGRYELSSIEIRAGE